MELDPSQDVETLLERFEAHMNEDELERAGELIDAALTSHPGEAALRAARAEWLIESESYEEGIGVLDELIGADEASEGAAELRNMRAVALQYAGRFDEARREFNDTVRLDPEHWGALLGRATVHERMGFLVAALLDLERVIGLDDQEAEPFALRARVFLRRGQLAEAARDFGYALESDPDDEESRLQLARLQARSGATAVAMELLEDLVEHGDSGDIVAAGALLRSQLAMGLGSTEMAMADARSAIERWPDRPWGHLQLAACQLSSMQPEEALKSLKEAERLVGNPRDLPDLFALRASALDQLDRPKQAERERANIEGSARLPAVVYGPILNPAQNVPINPDKPIDIRAIMADLFGHPDRAPRGYEDALREVVDRIPEIVAQNPEVERIQIELPQVEGMQGPARNLILQVNPAARRSAQDARA